MAQCHVRSLGRIVECGDEADVASPRSEMQQASRKPRLLLVISTALVVISAFVEPFFDKVEIYFGAAGAI